MKNFKKLNGIATSVVLALAAMAFAQTASAGTYNSSVNLPVLHSKGYVYTAHVPVSGGARNGQLIRDVAWTWNVHGWPRGLQVNLCQAPTRCLDVSRQRSGSTNKFNNMATTQPLYFELKLSPTSPSPIAGQIGRVTVTW